MGNNPSLPTPNGHLRALSFITCFSFIILWELCKYYLDFIHSNFAHSTFRMYKKIEKHFESRKETTEMLIVIVAWFNFSMYFALGKGGAYLSSIRSSATRPWIFFFLLNFSQLVCEYHWLTFLKHVLSSNFHRNLYFAPFII